VAFGLLNPLLATFIDQLRHEPVQSTTTGSDKLQKGRPEVPADWLREEWRKRGRLKRIQVTISGCVDPCDVPKVIVMNSVADRNGWPIYRQQLRQAARQ
jgi:hypothetical protein